MATHTSHFRTDTGLVGTIPSEGAGVNLGSTPKWKVLATESWQTEKFGLTVTQRWFSDGVYCNEYIECPTDCPVSTVQHPTVCKNDIKGAFYLDLGGSYDVSKTVSAYFKVDNALNHDPAPAPTTGVSVGANPFLYDLAGRTYRVGARFNF